MSRRSDENLKGIPMKPYDLLREGLIIFSLLAVVVVILAAFLGSPDYPTVRAEDVAKLQPLAFVETSANILAGNSDLQGYGPPYSSDFANAQQILGIAPANLLGVSYPIDPVQDFIIKPLESVAVMNKDVANALKTYQAASPEQQQAWTNAYLAALNKANVVNGAVQIPNGDYGPVSVMMNGMLELGQSGLLEGALNKNAWLPFNTDFTRSLLFFQDDVDHSVAQKLDMLGGLWGISHETGHYPGAWWLWPYVFFYQVPPMSTSPNGDLQVVLIITLVFLITLFTPFVPIINRLPRWLKVYRLVWRDWYQKGRMEG
jgi:hypothetical protein